MLAKVVGTVHHHGISKKTGRNYDFTEVHYVAPARGVNGEAALTTIVGSDVFPPDKIVPGVYSIEFDNQGKPIAMAPASVK